MKGLLRGDWLRRDWKCERETCFGMGPSPVQYLMAYKAGRLYEKYTSSRQRAAKGAEPIIGPGDEPEFEGQP